MLQKPLSGGTTGGGAGAGSAAAGGAAAAGAATAGGAAAGALAARRRQRPSSGSRGLTRPRRRYRALERDAGRGERAESLGRQPLVLAR